MNREEREQKLYEIFGRNAWYFEELFDPETDCSEQDMELAERLGKDIRKVTCYDVIDNINKNRPDLAKDFMSAIRIADDARIHGRLWTNDNPLRLLVNRKDVSPLEAFVIYCALCVTLGLD